MTNRYYLSQQELDELEYEHRHTSDKRYADRLKAMYLLGSGWQVSQVAQALMIDRESVRNHHKRYRKGGLMALQRQDAGGSDCALNSEQREQLGDYLQKHLCLTAKQVAHYVQQTWQISYSERGITQLLHRLGFVYKKPKLIPVKLMPSNSAPSLKRITNSRPTRKRKSEFTSWTPLTLTTIR